MTTEAPFDTPTWLIIPFGLLLLLIAIAPLAPQRIKHIWEKLYPAIAIGLGLLVAIYYLWRVPSGGHTTLHAIHEYFSFICLIGSLYIVAGGIHLNVKGLASPADNVIFLIIGGVLANFIGTTGASMVLIRPWMRMNKTRLSAYHIIFFIFIVSNIGGALTPIGDPPLFLGYLRGVPFFWLCERVIPEWLFTGGAVLVVFFLIDRASWKKRVTAAHGDTHHGETWRFEGGINVLFLLAIIGGVFVPERFFLREIVMISAAIASYRLTPKRVHEKNVFTFGPVKEVAFLFAGIFLTMMPALAYLSQHGQSFGLNEPLQYYFSAGSLSAVLDNAPTYLNFLQLAEAVARATDPAAFAALGGGDRAAVRLLIEHQPALVVVISLGAVFFGAMTYIGNGPNFMVKSIAESEGIKMPSFFGYLLKYSLPILLPILALGGWIFLG